jgi:hypothetical protein
MWPKESQKDRSIKGTCQHPTIEQLKFNLLNGKRKIINLVTYRENDVSNMSLR